MKRGIMSRRAGKRAAFELSITTMIVIVLAVVMLIMGLVLIRNIFTSSTETFDVLQKKTMDEINKLFTDENQKIMVYLGEGKLAKIKAGTSDAGILIAARTNTGAKIQEYSDLQYKIMLDEATQGNCVNTLGLAQTKSLFLSSVDEWIDITEYQGDTGKAVIRLNIPEGTTLCTQLVKLQVRDRTVNEEGENVGGTSFTIQVVRKGIF